MHALAAAERAPLLSDNISISYAALCVRLSVCCPFPYTCMFSNCCGSRRYKYGECLFRLVFDGSVSMCSTSLSLTLSRCLSACICLSVSLSISSAQSISLSLSHSFARFPSRFISFYFSFGAVWRGRGCLISAPFRYLMSALLVIVLR